MWAKQLTYMIQCELQKGINNGLRRSFALTFYRDVVYLGRNGQVLERANGLEGEFVCHGRQPSTGQKAVSSPVRLYV